ncbi:hypothetical protein OS493_008192 [Desmophyllum pertusum]|uniref:Uncharacterized protein n=1 Tax=Desmophyllum pertusum TaxID=174260 RepID=A0A9X0DAV7_9CNID|nr:hypothetical protein OS493_008192 [Desmophyllum pertusum]
MARFVAQIIILGGQVIGRAFAKALRQEFQSGAATQQASKGAQEGAKRAASNSVMGVSVQEAKQILNVQNVDLELIQKNYDHLYKINEKKAGGSFYLQSKVVRAKERLDEEFKMQEHENEKQKQRNSGESET